MHNSQYLFHIHFGGEPGGYTSNPQVALSLVRALVAVGAHPIVDVISTNPIVHEQVRHKAADFIKLFEKDQQ